ncbi:Abi-domain-containing protein [Anaeromyces robustus]|uniref:Abi-domain-containing protein n=1 Tax=Anaeromyces robustus TaxID=1754192 RepID=A0A1Y1WT98_9FUNG|nr:Abi-domain-containing protein [Anaeromyces robustus]|eukprot:ORX76672.1 Abi-domain-containing protein [Anaeromyces robustus]
MTSHLVQNKTTNNTNLEITKIKEDIKNENDILPLSLSSNEYIETNTNTNTNTSITNSNNVTIIDVKENSSISIEDNSKLDDNDDEEDEDDKSIKEQIINFFKQFTLKRVYITGVISFISLYIVNTLCTLIFNILIKKEGNSNEEDLNKFSNSFPILSIIYFCIVGPMFEEFVFRKLFFGVINEYSKIFAYIMSSFLFAFAHYNLNFKTLLKEFYNFPAYFISGIILAFTYDYDSYLLASMISHILYNSSVVIESSIF